MIRERMPQRRRAEVFDLAFGGLDYAVTLGRYPSGRVGEAFVSTAKAGSALAHLARDAAILISLGLQYGVPLEEMAGALTRTEADEPAGLAGAVIDAILRREGGLAPQGSFEAPALTVAPPDAALATIGFLSGPRLSGDICASCGAAAMVRTGTCLTCQACGSSSGGCS